MKLEQINRRIIRCNRCPRLRTHCREIARKKRRQFRDWDYWGKPVPSFGDPNARILILGLAPAAHGANRTGRMFTGDNSGNWLYRALFQAGLANQPTADHVEDGLRLRGVYITGSAHCAPPGNKPTTEELDQCFPYLVEELNALKDLKVVLATGGIAFRGALKLLATRHPLPKPTPRFGHGVEYPAGDLTLIGTYHPSQQNTFTGRLTEPMLKKVMVRARKLAGM